MAENGYFKELQEQINQLQDQVDGKDLQARIIENEHIEVFKSSVAASEITLLILQMMSELNEYVKKKGVTPATTASRKRLIKIFELSHLVEQATNENYHLKLINRDLHANYQMLRAENKDLKKKLESVTKAEQF